jgi:hypothetical protein
MPVMPIPAMMISIVAPIVAVVMMPSRIAADMDTDVADVDTDTDVSGTGRRSAQKSQC